MILAASVVMGLSLVSCASVGVVGAVYTGVTTPHSVTSNKLGSKVGSVKCTSILGIAAYGDASINSAAKMAGITKISHVDVKTFSVLGVYTTQTFFVYGE